MKRVLAIDPTHRGFGFAVFEGPDRLVDWGVVQVREKKHAAYLKRIGCLIEHHQATVVMAENVAAKGSRRGKRVMKLIASIHKLGTGRGVLVRLVSRTQICRAFHQSGALTKYEVAVAISRRFPELEPILPPRRKCYMSEDERMAVFYAISYFATVHGKLTMEHLRLMANVQAT